MASFNKVMIMGNITRDIELRATPKGTSVADIGLACNRVRMGEDGQKIEEVTYVDVTLWGRQAELASQYLGKGKPVFIEGRLSMDTWTDKETGKQRSKLKVVGENMQFIGGNTEKSATNRTANSHSQGSPAQHPGPMNDNLDNDIPF